MSTPNDIDTTVPHAIELTVEPTVTVPHDIEPTVEPTLTLSATSALVSPTIIAK